MAKRFDLKPRDPAAHEAARQIIANARDTILQRFGKAVRAIYLRVGTQPPVQRGSCVLLEAGDRKFIVTAAHVTDIDPADNLWIAGESGLIPIEGRRSCSNMPASGKRDDDKIDLAAYALSDDFVQLLGPVSWLHPSDIDPNDNAHVPKMYITLGYPNSRNKMVNNAKKVVYTAQQSYVGRVRAEVDYSKLGFWEESHVVVSFNKKGIVDSHGNRTNPVHPRGKSGGALFAVDRQQMQRPLDKRQVKLVGIIIEYHENEGVLVATRTSLLQAMLADAYVDTAAAFEPIRRLRINVSTDDKTLPT